MKIKTALFFIGTMLFVMSCASTPYDLGTHNPENIPEEDLVTVYIDNLCKVQRIDNLLLDIDNNKYQMVRIPPGLHTFYIRYGNVWVGFTQLYAPVVADLIKGNTYKLDASVTGRRVYYKILMYNDKKEGANIALQPSEAQLAEWEANLSFIGPQVLRGNSIKLENDKFLLVYRPNNLYTFTDKEANITTEGSYISPINLEFPLLTIGKVLFFDYDTDIVDSKNAMRKYVLKDYLERAHTILLPIKTTETEVVYLYDKPSEIRGTELIFDKIDIFK